MVLLTLREMTSWFDITVFELWVHFAALIISSFLLCLKFHNVINISYMWVASPLFVGLVSVFYFVFIIFLRSCVEYKDYRSPTLKFILNIYRLTCITLFIYMLVEKISGEWEKSEVANRNTYGMVFLPMWFLLGSWGLQMCRASNN
ncbi:hypothetical protein CAEBREN_23984 [Caenorhabditis brenneri]|uniref:Uncharacterized protein n=1 Tax=Caenorhabditis brenneri TaxID=135651 RepID=G0NYD5_CAEBE|nr:hypothetical protein CAEBREN_23984 [Caenorhabditis brenneri]